MPTEIPQSRWHRTVATASIAPAGPKAEDAGLTKSRDVDAAQYYGDLVHRRVTGSFLVTESRFQGGTSLPTHSHDAAYFTFTLEGSYRECYGAESRTCVPGTAVGHPAHESHSQLFDREPALLLRLASTGDNEFSAYSGFDRPRALTSPLIAHAVWRLHQELQRADDYTEMIVEGIAYEVAGRVLRGTMPLGGSRSRALRTQAHMRACLRRPPSISTLAAELGVSRGTLYRDFRSAFRCTPGDYLRQARIDAAVEELRKSRKTLADIALECGFYDQSHFNRCFRIALGCSHSEFRSGAS